jgi:hypothetical protein
VPIVCIEDDEEAREQTRARINDVRFSSDDTLQSAVADAARERLRAERTVVRGAKVTARARTPSTSSRRPR